MFNITVLRMKDIIKFFIGITFILLIVYISKFLYKDKSESKFAKKLADGAEILISNNMTHCLDDAILAVATVNDNNNASLLDNKKEENIRQSNVLESILKTQISSLRAMEISEKGANEIETAKSTNQTDSNSDTKSEKIELARNRFTNTSYN